MPTDPSPKTRPPVNYVFVDYENVPDVDLTMIGEKTVYLTLLLGVRQTKLNTELVERLMAHAASVQLVRLESPGKNALDFALTYYLGRAVQADPNAYFHLISKDTGFDPLIEHLKKRQFDVQRHDDSAALIARLSWKPPAAKAPANDTPASDVLKRVVDDLRAFPANTPKTRTKLANFVKARFGVPAPSKEVINNLIGQMEKASHVKIDGKGKVEYHVK